MKCFAVVAVSLLFGIILQLLPSRCHAQESYPYDQLDIATAVYARGYVPDSMLMDVVHSLTPGSRKQVQDLRRRIAKRKTELKEEEEKLEKARQRVENRKANYQQARRRVNDYNECMKERRRRQQQQRYGEQHQYKWCGNENDLMDERDRRFEALGKAERLLKDVLSAYRHIRDLIKKLEKALLKLLKNDNPKPSVQPRPYNNNNKNNYKRNNNKNTYGDYGGGGGKTNYGYENNKNNYNNYRSASGYSSNYGYGSYGEWR